MQLYADEMGSLVDDLATVFWCPYDIDMSPEEEEQFHLTTHCNVCEHPFVKNLKTVREHLHLLPEKNYRGTAHEECNINYKNIHVVRVIIHKLSGYDAHSIVIDIATRIGWKYTAFRSQKKNAYDSPNMYMSTPFSSSLSTVSDVWLPL